MRKCDVVVKLKNDKDARPIALLVQTASQGQKRMAVREKSMYLYREYQLMV